MPRSNMTNASLPNSAISSGTLALFRWKPAGRTRCESGHETPSLPGTRRDAALPGRAGPLERLVILWIVGNCELATVNPECSKPKEAGFGCLTLG